MVLNAAERHRQGAGATTQDAMIVRTWGAAVLRPYSRLLVWRVVAVGSQMNIAAADEIPRANHYVEVLRRPSDASG